MPRAYPDYPFVEIQSHGFSDDEIAQAVADALSQNPHLSMSDGGPLDGVCRAFNVDVEYSGLPCEVLLEVPLDGKAVIWLPRQGKIRHDRLMLATGIGHWLLHVPQARKTHPKAGIQALYAPKDPDALHEARQFALCLLMPEEQFTSLWYEGRAQLVAETLNVPTQAVYDRAKDLALHDGLQGANEPETEPEPVLRQGGSSGFARQI